MKSYLIVSSVAVAALTYGCHTSKTSSAPTNRGSFVSIEKKDAVAATDSEVGGFELAGSGSSQPYETTWSGVNLFVGAHHTYGILELSDGGKYETNEAEGISLAKANRASLWTMFIDTIKDICTINGSGRGVLRYKSNRTDYVTTHLQESPNVWFAYASYGQDLACEEPKEPVMINQRVCQAALGHPLGMHIDLASGYITSQPLSLGSSVQEFSVATKEILLEDPTTIEQTTATVSSAFGDQLQSACSANGGLFVLMKAGRTRDYRRRIFPSTGVYDWMLTVDSHITYSCCKMAPGA